MFIPDNGKEFTYNPFNSDSSIDKRKNNSFWANFGAVLFGETFYLQYRYP